MKQVGNVLALHFDVQYIFLKALALALFAQEVDICHELHLYGNVAIPFAHIAASAVRIEGEVFGLEAA